jgi:hypothetical protein
LMIRVEILDSDYVLVTVGEKEGFFGRLKFAVSL